MSHRANTLFTRRRFGFDRRVLLCLLLTALFSVALLGFRMATGSSCEIVQLSTAGTLSDAGSARSNTYYPGETVVFSLTQKGGKEILWDFGDQSTKAAGSNVNHQFVNTGSFIVTATVDGSCTESVTILIREQPGAFKPGSATASGDIIAGNDVPPANTPVIYQAAVAAKSYEWSILNSPEPVQLSPTATFTFPFPGKKIIQLKLDGDPDKIYTKEITVVPAQVIAPPDGGGAVPPIVVAPPGGGIDPSANTGLPPPPASKTPPVIAPEDFTRMLDEVTDGKKDASSFDQYLCSGANTLLIDDGKSNTTLGAFCSKIFDRKKIKIKNVIIVRDPQSTCVIRMTVYYKKSGFLGL